MALFFARDPFLFVIIIAYIYVVCDLTGILTGEQSNNLEKIVVENTQMEGKVIHMVNNKDPDHRGIFFDCANIDMIEIEEELEQSVNEQMFLGEYHGSCYIVKMVTSQTHAVAECLSKVKENTFTTPTVKEKCHGHAIMNNMKEILFHHELRHSNISPLVGYCVRNNNFSTSDLRYHGVISVFQCGEEITMDTISTQSWQDRLKHIHELSLLLLYFQNSPIGSILYPDLKISDFEMIDSKIKLSNIGGVVTSEPLCQNGFLCEGRLVCRQGRCVGFNAKQNLLNVYKMLIRPLLSDTEFPPNVTQIVAALKSGLNNMEMNTTGLVQLVESICRIVRLC